LPTSTPKQPEQCRMSQSIAQHSSNRKYRKHSTAVTGRDVNILSVTDMTTFISDPSQGDICSDKGGQKNVCGYRPIAQALDSKPAMQVGSKPNEVRDLAFQVVCTDVYAAGLFDKSALCEAIFVSTDSCKLYSFDSILCCYCGVKVRK